MDKQLYQSPSVEDLENLKGLDPLVNIFCNLISYDTTADSKSTNIPSSIGQLRLGAYLLATISDLGFKAEQSKEGVIYVNIPATDKCKKKKSICFLAHLDTSEAWIGKDIKPGLVKRYKKNHPIVLNKDCSYKINASNTPVLKKYQDHDLIFSTNNTLLGADDKSGVAILLYLLYELSTKNIEHGPIVIVFSVDEEIGKSCNYIDLKKINCDYGITIDGTDIGDLDIANFNAKQACIKFYGNSVHPAVGYKKLKNSINILNDFLNMLPDCRPENTKGMEGFFHVYDIHASVGSSEVCLLLRDFNKDELLKKEQTLKDIVKTLRGKYGKNSVSIEIIKQYENMQKVLERRPKIVEICKKAYKQAKIKVKLNYIRGGTDGATLTNKGMPTPNIFTGAFNCHGPYEGLSVQSMHKSYEVVLNIINIIAH